MGAAGSTLEMQAGHSLQLSRFMFWTALDTTFVGKPKAILRNRAEAEQFSQTYDRLPPVLSANKWHDRPEDMTGLRPNKPAKCTTNFGLYLEPATVMIVFKTYASVRRMTKKTDTSKLMSGSGVNQHTNCHKHTN